MNLKFDVLIRDNAEFDIESLCKQDDYSCPTLKGRIGGEDGAAVTLYLIKTLQTRPLLVSAPELRVYNHTGLFLSNTENNIIRKPLGELASDDEISNSIKTIQKLIQNYENYVVGYEHSYGTRIIEAILYAFVSPFIWEIKGKPELVDGARTIPQFMILGGTANSGKSKLLTIIKKMMGLYGSQNWYLYSEICQGDRYKASKTIEFMNACMIEENVNPFLVDELDADFFLIKIEVKT